jgi:hypothetical protein
VLGRQATFGTLSGELKIRGLLSAQ